MTYSHHTVTIYETHTEAGLRIAQIVAQLPCVCAIREDHEKKAA